MLDNGVDNVKWLHVYIFVRKFKRISTMQIIWLTYNIIKKSSTNGPGEGIIM